MMRWILLICLSLAACSGNAVVDLDSGLHPDTGVLGDAGFPGDSGSSSTDAAARWLR